VDGEFREQSQTGGTVTYVLAISESEAAEGKTRILTRNGRRLEVKVPAGVRDGLSMRLTNALRVTDGRDGDIIIRVQVTRAAPAGGVQVVTDATFETEVLKAALPVLVDFWASWCGPCRALGPVIEGLASKYDGRVKFCKLNVDENRLAAGKYQVMSIPTVLLFKGGLIAGMSVGAVAEGELRARIDKVLAGA
jgi:thioredoxin 1